MIKKTEHTIRDIILWHPGHIRSIDPSLSPPFIEELAFSGSLYLYSYKLAANRGTSSENPNEIFTGKGKRTWPIISEASHLSQPSIQTEKPLFSSALESGFQIRIYFLLSPPHSPIPLFNRFPNRSVLPQLSTNSRRDPAWFIQWIGHLWGEIQRHHLPQDYLKIKSRIVFLKS